jgi:hypothetical protein
MFHIASLIGVNMGIAGLRVNADLGGKHAYSDLQMRIRRRAICLIDLFADLPNQERSASKQLAPQLPLRICKPV